DPSLMAARFSLAEVSAHLEKWERAEICYRQALQVCERILGEKHPVTLKHQERAAMVLLHLGKLAEARSTLQRVLEIRARTQGVQHPDVASCLHSLAQEQVSE